MAEEAVVIQAGDETLEALLDSAPGHKAVVVTHPHPLYGGDMYNLVVAALCHAWRGQARTTLRFNFRGVGRSSGTHGGGEEEVGDVTAAAHYLEDLGKTAVDLAGYSFGAWVSARAASKIASAQRLIMVSPPVVLMDFAFLEAEPRLALVVTGSRDEIAPASAIQQRLSAWNPGARLEVIPGADHFYGGKTQELMKIIADFLGPAGS